MINFVTFSTLITLMDGRLHTAKELAEKNEVSVKTIQRAITTLESAGIFVMSKKGKFGGYQIHKSSIPQLSSLSPTELGELMSICKFKESLLPSSSSFGSMQNAIINSTPENNLGKALSASSKIVFDSLPWNKKEIDNKKFDKVYSACTGLLELEIQYTSFSGSKTKRIIEPYCMTLKDGAWYTYAKDQNDQKMKLFKLSRINKINATGNSFVLLPDVLVHEKPWNSAAGFKTRKVKVKIINSKLEEAREWLTFETTEPHDSYTVVSANILENLGFYMKLMEEAKYVKLLSPLDMIENLMMLCKDVQNIYTNSY